MTTREYNVVCQSIYSLDAGSALGSEQISFVRCLFLFDDSWNSIPHRVAQFTQDGKTYDVLLDADGACMLPHELHNGYVNISVYGNSSDGIRATTVPVREHINTSGYKADALNSEKLTPSLYEQFLQRVEEAIASGGGSGGVGFDDWRYDEEGNLHILDADGNDVLPPLYIPGVNNEVLSDEDIALARSLVETAKDYAEQAKLEKETAATHSQSAEEFSSSASASAEEAAISAEEARNAAQQTKEYAEQADVIKKLGDLEDLSQSAERSKIAAKAAEGYAKDAQNAAEGIKEIHEGFSAAVESARTAIESSATTAAEAAETAVNAAQRSEDAITEAVAGIEAARDTALEEVRAESGNILHSADENMQFAIAAKDEAQAYATSANASATEAAESESNAAHYAEAAQQVAEKNGYLYFNIEDGHLFETRTDNVEEDMIFTIEEGRLIVTYE